MRPGWLQRDFTARKAGSTDRASSFGWVRRLPPTGLLSTRRTPTTLLYLDSQNSKADTLRELFSRVGFNVSVGNIDDHARNHAMFWDGHPLELTPAYDLCSAPRSGGTAAQAMAISARGDRESRLSVCLDAASDYGISAAMARDIIEGQVAIISCAVAQR